MLNCGKLRILLRAGGGLELVKSVSLPISHMRKLRPDCGGDLPRVTHSVVGPVI